MLVLRVIGWSVLGTLWVWWSPWAYPEATYLLPWVIWRVSRNRAATHQAIEDEIELWLRSGVRFEPRMRRAYY